MDESISELERNRRYHKLLRGGTRIERLRVVLALVELWWSFGGGTE